MLLATRLGKVLFLSQRRFWKATQRIVSISSALKNADCNWPLQMFLLFFNVSKLARLEYFQTRLRASTPFSMKENTCSRALQKPKCCYSFDKFHPLTASHVNFRLAFLGMKTCPCHRHPDLPWGWTWLCSALNAWYEVIPSHYEMERSANNGVDHRRKPPKKWSNWCSVLLLAEGII